MKEITGLGWLVITAFVFIILGLFVYCSLIINSRYENNEKDQGKKK